MIELYQLRWSHYVEKVRWALDFKRLAWREIEIVAYSKREMQRFACPQRVPLIHDTASGVALSESSSIVRYLDETYPQPALLPAAPAGRDAAWRWMLHLDSTLGLHARRLGYTQLIMEAPAALSSLFLRNVLGGLFTRAGWGALAAPILGAMLVRRFRFDRNRADRVHEQLEAQLLPIAARIDHDGFLVGGGFTGADLTLASLLRPLRIVPHFRDHPRLQSLFAWQERLFREHGRDPAYAYEELIRARRERRRSMRGRVSWLRTPVDGAIEAALTPPLRAVHNDQHPVSRGSLLLGLPGYLKLRWFSGVGRVPYVAGMPS